MIELVVIHKNAYVFNVEDWLVLRKEHRIVGDLSGWTKCHATLPMVLLPEETILLVKKNFAMLVHYPKLLQTPTDECKQIYNKDLEELLDEENIVYKDMRRKELEPMIDKVIEGKIKKGKLKDGGIDREEFLREEVAKTSKITSTNMVVSLELEHPTELRGKSVSVSLEELYPKFEENQDFVLKYRVFEDLWSKGYYVTSGAKFGADYLVYTGDPTAYHACFIVKCVPETIKHNLNDLIALGRLGTSVKKRVALASCTSEGSNKNLIHYVTLTWDN